MEIVRRKYSHRIYGPMSAADFKEYLMETKKSKMPYIVNQAVIWLVIIILLVVVVKKIYIGHLI